MVRRYQNAIQYPYLPRPRQTIAASFKRRYRRAIALAFQQSKNDHSAAAKRLGVHPNYLYRLMRNLGMRQAAEPEETLPF